MAKHASRSTNARGVAPPHHPIHGGSLPRGVIGPHPGRGGAVVVGNTTRSKTPLLHIYACGWPQHQSGAKPFSHSLKWVSAQLLSHFLALLVGPSPSMLPHFNRGFISIRFISTYIERSMLWFKLNKYSRQVTPCNRVIIKLLPWPNHV